VQPRQIIAAAIGVVAAYFLGRGLQWLSDAKDAMASRDQRRK